MGEYYDKDKFTGGRSSYGASGGGTPPPPPPRRPYQTPPPPPKKNKNNSGWYSWPVIIVLFALGIWPIALALLFLNLFGDNGKNKKTVNTS